jgi:hypothetical protein
MPTVQQHAANFWMPKHVVADTSFLDHPVPTASFSLVVDALATRGGHIAAEANWRPHGFFSRKLKPAQVNYPAFDRELLACYLGIRHFHFML